MAVIAAGDHAAISFGSEPQAPVFPAIVEFAPRSCIVLRCPRACIELLPPNNTQTRLNARFFGDRARFLAMHVAINAVNIDTLFPSPPATLLPPPVGFPLFDESLVQEQRE